MQYLKVRTLLLVSFVMITMVMSTGVAVAKQSQREDQLETEAKLATIAASGVRGEVEIVDTGTALIVKAEAEGLDPCSFPK